MSSRLFVVLSFASVGLVSVPGQLRAQQEDPPPTATQVAQPPVDPPTLVFEREVFGYPSYQRRNPFTSLVLSDGGGPWFEELELLMVIHSDLPAQSVATLGAGVGLPGAEEGALADPSKVTRRMRIGDVWGNTRIKEILKRSVIVEVTEFGLTEQRVLELPIPGVGGS